MQDARELARIAETSRGLVDSMSDIVWAINPEVDSLSDLVHRMRRFAEDTLSADDIDLTCHAPELRQDPRLGPGGSPRDLPHPERERHEHRQARRVPALTVELEADRRRLRLRVTDDGRGFDPEQKTDGNGVSNMRRRVVALGGRLTIQSRPGRGATIELEAPFQTRSGLLPQ